MGESRIRRGGAAGLLLAFVAVVLPLTVAPRLVGDAEAAPPPANDNFAAAQVLAPTGGTLTLDSAGATKEVGEPDHAGDAGGASVWFKWTAPATANVSIDTSGSGFDTDARRLHRRVRLDADARRQQRRRRSDQLIRTHVHRRSGRGHVHDRGRRLLRRLWRGDSALGPEGGL